MCRTAFVPAEDKETRQKHEAGNCRTRKDELRVTRRCFNKPPLPPSSTGVLSHGKKHFHQCVPRNTFFKYIASLRQQTASNGNSFVISVWGEMKFQVLSKIRPLFSQNGHLSLADPSECPGAHPCASMPHVNTGNGNASSAGRCYVALNICSWGTGMTLQKSLRGNKWHWSTCHWVSASHPLPCMHQGVCGKHNAWWCS